MDLPSKLWTRCIVNDEAFPQPFPADVRKLDPMFGTGLLVVVQRTSDTEWLFKWLAERTDNPVKRWEYEHYNTLRMVTRKPVLLQLIGPSSEDKIQ